MTPGLLIAAPASGTGKTTVMLGLLAALRERGLVVQPFKNGPDYIDPAFHLAASGRASLNLDTWAMGPEMLAGLASAGGDADLILAEGSMGLFDGVAVPGATGNGATGRLMTLRMATCATPMAMATPAAMAASTLRATRTRKTMVARKSRTRGRAA